MCVSRPFNDVLDWPGRSIFFCGGRLLLGSKPGMFVGAFLTEVSLGVGFAYLVALERFDQEIYALPSVGLALVFFSLIVMLRTAFRDPGIIPRGDPDQPLPPNHKVFIEEDVNGIRMKLRWCTTCLIYREPRSKHCKLCNNCVSRFDHHCPWVGNCVGARNYASFCAYVWSTCAALVVTAVCTGQVLHVRWIADREDPDSVNDGSFEAFLVFIGNQLPRMFLFSFLAVLILPLLSLSLLHLRLVSINLTTNEDTLELYDDTGNPFDEEACCANWKASPICMRTPPQQVDFTAKMDEELLVTNLAKWNDLRINGPSAALLRGRLPPTHPPGNTPLYVDPQHAHAPPRRVSALAGDPSQTERSVGLMDESMYCGEESQKSNKADPIQHGGEENPALSFFDSSADFSVSRHHPKRPAPPPPAGLGRKAVTPNCFTLGEEPLLEGGEQEGAPLLEGGGSFLSACRGEVGQKGDDEEEERKAILQIEESRRTARD